MLKALDLSGQTAVICGGTSGLGRAVALALAEAGADVVATSRNLERVEAVADQIRAVGRRSLSVTADVTRRESLIALRDECLNSFGRIDILVNAAGQTRRRPTLEVSDEEWGAIFETNLQGTFRACQVFGEHMLERGYGRIINIASLGSFVALQEVAAYCASKAAVASLTRSLAIEWGPRGVAVNAIAPGVFPTELNRKLLTGSPRGEEFLLRTPLRRYGDPRELAGAAVFLASPAASFVLGEVLTVDGGFLASGVNQ